MGLSNENANRTFVNLKIDRSTDEGKEVDPKFILKDGDEKREFDSISGHITNIRRRENTYEGRVIESCQIDFYDVEDDRVYALEMSLSNLWRSIMNCLFSIEKLGKIKIRLYRTKSKKDDGKYYAGAMVSVDGDKLEWKYSYVDDMKPLIKEVEIRGKKEQDTYDLDNWVWKKVDEHLVPLIADLNASDMIIKDDEHPAEETMIDQVRKEREERKANEPISDKDAADDDLPF